MISQCVLRIRRGHKIIAEWNSSVCANHVIAYWHFDTFLMTSLTSSVTNSISFVHIVLDLLKSRKYKQSIPEYISTVELIFLNFDFRFKRSAPSHV
jgi:hypothetical protein